MTPWVEAPTIKLDLGLPIRERYTAHADALHSSALNLLNAIQGEITSTAKYAKYLAYAVNWRTRCRYASEARALAKIGGVDWKDLMVAAISYEIVLSIFACSTTAMATQSGPVLARNMDFWPEQALAASTYRMIFRRNNVDELTFAGWPGSLGVVTGMSNHGFAIALNAVESVEGIKKTGYPVMLYIRKVLEEAQNYHEALKMLRSQTLTAGALLTIVGTKNDERAVVERSPTRCEVREAEGNEPLITTNHYRVLDDKNDEPGNTLTQTSCGRFEALGILCADPNFSEPKDEALLYALSDEQVLQDITAQHVIMRPAMNEMKLYVPRRLVDQT